METTAPRFGRSDAKTDPGDPGETLEGKLRDREDDPLPFARFSREPRLITAGRLAALQQVAGHLRGLGALAKEGNIARLILRPNVAICGAVAGQ